MCYAATNSISLDVSSSRVYGRYSYGQAGHQVKLTVYYYERNNTTGAETCRVATDVQNGNMTTAVVTKNKTSGWTILWGQAFGYIDGNVETTTGKVYA